MSPQVALNLYIAHLRTSIYFLKTPNSKFLVAFGYEDLMKKVATWYVFNQTKWSELCGFFSNKNAYNVIDLKWHFTSTSFQIHILIKLKSIHTLHQQGKKMPYHNLFKSFKLKIQIKPLLLKPSIEMNHLHPYFFKFLRSYVF